METKKKKKICQNKPMNERSEQRKRKNTVLYTKTGEIQYAPLHKHFNDFSEADTD